MLLRALKPNVGGGGEVVLVKDNRGSVPTTRWGLGSLLSGFRLGDSVKVGLYFKDEAATCTEATSFEGEGNTSLIRTEGAR
jgi:hypothetical protein